jgi:SAM-dependent methyltransferase
LLERAAGEIKRGALRNAELCVMDAQQLGIQDEVFDVVLCSFAFLSFPDQRRALAEFRRVLAPDGRLGLLDAFGWFLEHDSRWHWQAELLRSFGALKRDGAANQGPAVLETMLHEAGYTLVEVVDDAYDLIFRDEDEWWWWMWSHASRHLFESVPPIRRPEFKGRLFHGLAQCRQDDGLIHGTLRAVLAPGRNRASTTSPRLPTSRSRTSIAYSAQRDQLFAELVRGKIRSLGTLSPTSCPPWFAGIAPTLP